MERDRKGGLCNMLLNLLCCLQIIRDNNFIRFHIPQTYISSTERIKLVLSSVGQARTVLHAELCRITGEETESLEKQNDEQLHYRSLSPSHQSFPFTHTHDLAFHFCFYILSMIPLPVSVPAHWFLFTKRSILSAQTDCKPEATVIHGK